MSSIKCPQCGLVTWEGEIQCKRCGASLDPKHRDIASMLTVAGHPPDRVYSQSELRKALIKKLVLAGLVILLIVLAFVLIWRR